MQRDDTCDVCGVWIKTGVLGHKERGAMEEPEDVKEPREGQKDADLKRGGWTGDSLAFFDGMSLDEVKKILGGVCSTWGLNDFEDLRKEAKRRRRALDVEDHRAGKEPSSGHKDIEWKPQEGKAVLSGKEYGLPLEQARKLMPRMIWPTRFQRRLRHCTEDAQREKVEEGERNRQINRLLELLGKTGLLKEDTRREGAASAWMTRRRAMGRRASTLRAHIRLGVRMREFTVGCLDSDWFGNVGDLMDYIAGRLEEPCGRSVPLSIMAAVRFLEAAAEVPMEKRLSENPILQNFMSEISKSGWWATRTRTSANRLLLAVVFCWEFLVMEESQRAYIRLFAWFKLVKLWAMLRWNDTMGIPAARLQYVKKKGLVGEIVRSKTTGIGRRIEVQQFSVAEEAWFLAEGWLREGYKLFEAFGREGGLERRDFMMARPNSTLSGFRSSMVSYADAMAMSRTLLTELVAPAQTGGELAKLVLSNETGSFWSEHSERVTMASWSAALGIQQEVIKRWGRWRPSVDEEYVKTTQILVTKAQAEVARRVKSEGLKTDLVGEEEVISQVEERLRERGVAEEIIKKQSKRFRFYRLAYRESMEGAVESGEKDEANAEVTSMAGSAVEPFDFEELEAESEQPLSVVGMGTFVMSIVGRSKKRTLHRVGSCYRIPGVDYRDYVVIGDDRPTLIQGEKLCGSCFRKEDKAVSESEAEMVPSSESSSSDLLSSDPDDESDGSN